MGLGRRGNQLGATSLSWLLLAWRGSVEDRHEAQGRDLQRGHRVCGQAQHTPGVRCGGDPAGAGDHQGRSALVVSVGSEATLFVKASSLAARSRSASPPCSATHPPRPATLLRPFFAQASRSRSPSTACAPMTVPPARGRWVRRGGQQVVAAAPAAPGGPVGVGPAERRLLGPQRSAAGPEAHRNPWRPRRRRVDGAFVTSFSEPMARPQPGQDLRRRPRDHLPGHAQGTEAGVLGGRRLLRQTAEPTGARGRRPYQPPDRIWQPAARIQAGPGRHHDRGRRTLPGDGGAGDGERGSVR